MKRLARALGAMGVMVILSGSAYAIVLNEVYLGTSTDGNYVTLGSNESHEFRFDLGATNPSGWGETTDETRFGTPGATNINSAVLGFWFSSSDTPTETVKIYAEYRDDGNLIATQTFDLGQDGWYEYLGNWRWEYHDPIKEWTGYEAPLTGSFLNMVADGKFDAIVLSTDHSDIRIDQAYLKAEASSPVPEPGTMLLLGSGLMGLAGYGRRRMKK